MDEAEEEGRMMDLEARARELVQEIDQGRLGKWRSPEERRGKVAALIASWARRLVAESRAGVLREALPYMKHQPLCAVTGRYDYGCTCGRSALAAAVRAGATGEGT